MYKHVRCYKYLAFYFKKKKKDNAAMIIFANAYSLLFAIFLLNDITTIA